MVDLNNTLNEKLGELFGLLGKGKITVETHTDYDGGGLDNQQAGTSGITLNVTGDALESDNQLSRRMLALLSKVKTLGENVQFESDRKHAENMANRLAEFIKEGAAIPENFIPWFTRQAEKDARPAGDHAIHVEKTDLGIRVKIKVPEGQDATLIARHIEEKKAAIIEALAKRTVKYWNAEAKDAVEAQIKGLDYVVTSVKDEYHNSVEIEIRSQKQLEKIKGADNKWSVTLTGDEPKELRESNPLSSLPDGDGKTPESPALLQKALARAILFDDKTPRDYFPQIAGTKDMQIAITKALVNLKAAKPDTAKKVDDFLNDEMFKEHDRWGGTHVQRISGIAGDGTVKAPPSTHKVNHVIGSNPEQYQAGRIKIDLPLPALKFNEVMAALENDVTAAIELVKKELSQQTPQAAAPAIPAAVSAIIKNPDGTESKTTLNPQTAEDVAALAAIAGLPKAEAEPAAPAPEAPKPPVAVAGQVFESKPAADARITPEVINSFLEKVKAEAAVGAPASRTL